MGYTDRSRSCWRSPRSSPFVGGSGGGPRRAHGRWASMPPHRVHPRGPVRRRGAERIRVGAAGRDRVARIATIAAAPIGALSYLVWVQRRVRRLAAPVPRADRRVGSTESSRTRSRRCGTRSKAASTARSAPRCTCRGWWCASVSSSVVFMRWPPSYGVFATVVVLSTVTSENLASLERYALLRLPARPRRRRPHEEQARRSASSSSCSPSGCSRMRPSPSSGVSCPSARGQGQMRQARSSNAARSMMR